MDAASLPTLGVLPHTARLQAKTEWPQVASMEVQCRPSMNDGDRVFALPIAILVCLSLRARRDPRTLHDRRRFFVNPLDCLLRSVRRCFRCTSVRTVPLGTVLCQLIAAEWVECPVVSYPRPYS